MNITITHKGHTTSLFTHTKDMDCWSFSIPALTTCPLKVINTKDDTKLAICGTCYATINHYARPSTIRAQIIRYAWAAHHVAEGDFSQLMTHHITTIIPPDSHDPRFRGHDSGDFFSPQYAQAWHEVCQNTPWVHYWFPTRNWHKDQDKWRHALEPLAALPNVTVRPSALHYNDPPPHIPWLSHGSTAVTNHQAPDNTTLCPKLEAGSCTLAGCSKCWGSGQVAYQAHGLYGKHTPTRLKPDTLKRRQHRITAMLQELLK